MSNVKFNQSDMNQQLIIAALANMIDEGFSARETFQVLEEIKKNVWSGLKELEMELNPSEQITNDKNK